MILLRALLRIRRHHRKDEHEEVDVITIYEETEEIRPVKPAHHKKRHHGEKHKHRRVHNEQSGIKRQGDVGNVLLDERVVVETLEERLQLELLLEQGRLLLDQLDRQISGGVAPAALSYGGKMYHDQPQTHGRQLPMAVTQPCDIGAAFAGLASA